MSTYLLHRTLCNMGFPASTVSLAVDVLQGRHRADDDGQTDGPGPEPAAEWPAWTDEDRWTITEPDYEPSADDLEWLAGGLSDEQIDAIARACAWQDHLEGLARVTDADVARVNGAG